MNGYYLIGEHLGHSFSADIHRRFGRYDYALKELSPAELGPFLERRDFAGLNVTIPYKEAVIPWLDRLDESAAAIGAVNTVVNRDGELWGYNTDFGGMAAALTRNAIEIKGKAVLILGTGGTSKTALAVCRALGAGELFRVSRTGREGAITYEQAAALFGHVHERGSGSSSLKRGSGSSSFKRGSGSDAPHPSAPAALPPSPQGEGFGSAEHPGLVLINCTPVGMWPDLDSSPIEPEAFQSCHSKPCPERSRRSSEESVPRSRHSERSEESVPRSCHSERSEESVPPSCHSKPCPERSRRSSEESVPPSRHSERSEESVSPLSRHSQPCPEQSRRSSEESASPVPLSAVFDCVYNPLRTRLVVEAQARGIPAAGGLYMLVKQAALACEHFTGTPVEEERVDIIYNALRRRQESIVLIGMPGAGKTTVGRILAQKTGKEFVDIDEEIERQAGKPIPAIFAEAGERAFREQEAAVVRALSGRTGLVIATGGGTVLREENVRLLKRYGRLVFLDRPPEALEPSPDRPLGDTREKLARLYTERYPIYKAAADETIDAGGPPETVAERIAP